MELSCGARLWKTKWQLSCCLIIHCDSVVMLTWVVNLRPHTRQLRVIAQKLAVELAEFSVVPVGARHLSGVVNAIADALSRMSQPFSCVTFPSF